MSKSDMKDESLGKMNGKKTRMMVIGLAILVILGCAIGVSCIFLGREQGSKMVPKLKVNGETYIFNQVAQISRKVETPVGSKVELDTEQVIQYLGKDVQLKDLPQGMKSLSTNDLQHVYVDEKGNMVFDNITYYYQKEGDETTSAPRITMIVSKGDLPVVNEENENKKNEITKVGGVECQFSYTPDGECEVGFLKDGIGYNVRSQNVVQKDFVNVVNSIIK